MALVLLAVFLVVPFAELAVIVGVADTVGLGATFLALVLFSVAGAMLLRQQGFVLWRRANEELARGRVPATELMDGAMVLGGGALLLTPGFLTDLFGLTLLLPPTRALLRPLFRRAMQRRVQRRTTMVFGTAGSPWDRPDVHDTTGRAADPPGDRSSWVEVVDIEVDRPRGLSAGGGTEGRRGSSG